MAGFFSNMMSDFTKFVGQDDMSKKIRGIENKIKELKQKENAFYFSIGKQAIEKYGYDVFENDGKALLQILENIKVSEKELEEAKAEKVKLEAEEKARREAEKAATSTVAINNTVTASAANQNIGVQVSSTPVAQDNSNPVVTFDAIPNTPVKQETVVHTETEVTDTNEESMGTEVNEEIVQVDSVQNSDSNVVIKCQNCGETYDKEFAFCQKCGTKMEKVNVVRKFCSDCGAENTDDSKFCCRCGRQF